MPSCPVVTAQAAKGFLALADDLPEFDEPARRACGYLRSLFDECGRVRPASEDHPTAWLERLPVLPVLWQAAQRWDDQAYRVPASRGLELLLTGVDEPGCSGPAFSVQFSSGVAQEVEVLVDMGRMDAAAQLMERIHDRQRRDGSIFELPHGPGMPPKHALTWSSTIAGAAALWYRLGDRERADRAMRYLERRQRRDGSLPHRPRRRIPAWRGRDAWAVKHYLDAAPLRVRAAFEAGWEELPDCIDPADGRMQVVRRWFQTLPPGARVADVGCGKGRFLKHLVEWFPAVRLTGIDIVPAMLARLPNRIEAREGDMLRIPATDGEFDGAFAVESLEHSLVPRRAIAELCRIARPGGRILVIDKHRAKQPLSEHDPWERWLLPEELAGWLARYCDNVTIEPVSHSEGRAATDLFLAAEGTRRICAPTHCTTGP